MDNNNALQERHLKDRRPQKASKQQAKPSSSKSAPSKKKASGTSSNTTAGWSKVFYFSSVIFLLSNTTACSSPAVLRYVRPANYIDDYSCAHLALSISPTTPVRERSCTSQLHAPEIVHLAIHDYDCEYLSHDLSMVSGPQMELQLPAIRF